MEGIAGVGKEFREVVPDTAFVFNPTAQSGRAEERWDDLLRMARELGMSFVRFDTEEGRTHLLAEELAVQPAVRKIIAVGGDGTISQVISGMMRARDLRGINRDQLPRLAIIPFGTANNIAKSFRIPTGRSDDSLEAAMEIAAHGLPYHMDVGRLDKHVYFADAFSLGVDPEVLHERNVTREKIQTNPLLREVLRDYALYAWCAARKALRSRRVSARLHLDDHPVIKLRRLTNLIVNNTRVYAGEFVFLQGSRENDGLLDVILFCGLRDQLSKMLASTRMAPLDESALEQLLLHHSSNYQAKRIRIRLSKPLYSQIDGEELRLGREFQIECVPDALTVLVPPDPLHSTGDAALRSVISVV
ncbi:MAG: diacylglycerol/lipid kinase family protein [Candidatus Xenobia bacterium]